jgi:GT2 family glycosyltransferase
VARFDYCLVNYRCSTAVLETISWVRACPGWSGAFHVVDNSGDMPELDEDDVQVYRPAWNVGYLGGLLHAMQQSTGDGWFVASNPDVRVSSSFFADLGQLSVEAGVVAPRIIGSDGRDQNPFMRRRPSIAAVLSRYVVFGTPALKRLYIWLRSRREAKGFIDGPNRIYAPHGACFAVSPVARDRLVDVTPYAFLYAEELTVGEEAQRHSIPVRYEPSLVVQHLGGETTRALPARTISRFQRQALTGYIRSRLKHERQNR